MLIRQLILGVLLRRNRSEIGYMAVLRRLGAFPSGYLVSQNVPYDGSRYFASSRCHTIAKIGCMIGAALDLMSDYFSGGPESQ